MSSEPYPNRLILGPPSLAETRQDALTELRFLYGFAADRLCPLPAIRTPCKGPLDHALADRPAFRARPS